MINIVQDTREKIPYSFLDQPDVAVCKAALPAGDYSILGLEHDLAVERKSLSDWANTLSKGWRRFRIELLKLSGYRAAVIIVEGSRERLLRHDFESQLSPDVILAKTALIKSVYGVETMYCEDREEARMATLRWLREHSSCKK